MPWVGTAISLGTSAYSYWKDQKDTQDIIDRVKPSTDRALDAINRGMDNTKDFYGSQERTMDTDDSIYMNDLESKLKYNTNQTAESTRGVANMQYSAGAESKYEMATNEANIGFGRETQMLSQAKSQRKQSLLQRLYDYDATRNQVISSANQAGYLSAGQSDDPGYQKLIQQASSIV